MPPQPKSSDRRLQRLAQLQEGDQRQQALDTESAYRGQQAQAQQQAGLLQLLTSLYGIQSEEAMMPLKQQLAGAQTRSAEANAAGQEVENQYRPELLQAQATAERERAGLYGREKQNGPYNQVLTGEPLGVFTPEEAGLYSSPAEIQAARQQKAAAAAQQRQQAVAAEEARMGPGVAVPKEKDVLLDALQNSMVPYLADLFGQPTVRPNNPNSVMSAVTPVPRRVTNPSQIPMY